MLFKFTIPTHTPHFDAIEIAKKIDSKGTPFYINEKPLPPETRHFNDEYSRDGNLYSYQLLDCGKVIYTAPFVTLQVEQNKVILLSDLFVPEEIHAVGLHEDIYAVVIHQNSDPNNWWMTTRSWLVKVQGEHRHKYVVISDENLYPKTQMKLEDYQSIVSGNIYILPVQLFHYLQYASIQIEKSDYAYSKTIPKKFAIEELLRFINSSVIRFNFIPPVTIFAFEFGHSFTFTSVPIEWENIVTQLSVIEALRSLVFEWADLDTAYADGVDLQIQKFEKFQSFMDSMESRVMDEMRLIKQRYRGSGIVIGQKARSFAAPGGFSGRADINTAPWLATVQSYTEVEFGIFENRQNINSNIFQEGIPIPTVV